MLSAHAHNWPGRDRQHYRLIYLCTGGCSRCKVHGVCALESSSFVSVPLLLYNFLWCPLNLWSCLYSCHVLSPTYWHLFLLPIVPAAILPVSAFLALYQSCSSRWIHRWLSGCLSHVYVIHPRLLLQLVKCILGFILKLLEMCSCPCSFSLCLSIKHALLGHPQATSKLCCTGSILSMCNKDIVASMD